MWILIDVMCLQTESVSDHYPIELLIRASYQTTNSRLETSPYYRTSAYQTLGSQRVRFRIGFKRFRCTIPVTVCHWLFIRVAISVTTAILSVSPKLQTSQHFLRATAYILRAHMLSQFRLSVCLSVWHTGRLVKNGWS